jgi:glycosyltransferase involved in cell wall biosynthesis
MKILIVSPTFFPDVNGASYFTRRLADYLYKMGHTVLVIAPSRFMHNENYNLNGVSVFGIRSFPTPINGFRIGQPIFIKNTIYQKVKEFSPDIIHLQSHFLFGKVVVKIARELRIPVIGTNHFMPENLTHYLHLPKKVINWVNEFLWRDFAKVFNQIPFVTTPTEIAANLIRHRLKVPVIPVTCGIDLEAFNPKNDGEYLRKRYKIPKEKPVLLFVGRLDAEKRVGQVIEASAEALKKAAFTFVIGGKGFESNKLQKLADKLGIADSVIFTGFVPDEDLPSLYAIADCFVIACPFELQCIVVMEAMATGLPIIAVNAGALPHLVEDGVNGELFPPGDVKILTNKIVDFMINKEKRNKMGIESLHLIEKHGIKTMIEQYLAIYQQSIHAKSNL